MGRSQGRTRGFQDRSATNWWSEHAALHARHRYRATDTVFVRRSVILPVVRHSDWVTASGSSGPTASHNESGPMGRPLPLSMRTTASVVLEILARPRHVQRSPNVLIAETCVIRADRNASGARRAPSVPGGVNGRETKPASMGARGGVWSSKGCAETSVLWNGRKSTAPVPTRYDLAILNMRQWSSYHRRCVCSFRVRSGATSRNYYRNMTLRRQVPSRNIPSAAA